MPIDHIGNRERIIGGLFAELVGPAPGDHDLDCSLPISFNSYEEADKHWREMAHKEEILRKDPPCKRYGIGVLYPPKSILEPITPDDPDAPPLSADAPNPEGTTALTEEGADKLEAILKRTGRGRKEEGDTEDFEIASTNTYRPSAFGLSFLVELPKDATLIVTVTGGRYKQLPVSINGKESLWWLRSPVSMRAEYGSEQINLATNGKAPQKSVSATNTEGLDINIEAFTRPDTNNTRLLTICLVNHTPADGRIDEICLFQSTLNVEVISKDGKPHIFPYPKPPFKQLDHEEQSLALLYRNAEAFATGHGCAANWKTNDNASMAFSVSAEAMPCCETASITPDIRRRGDGSMVEVSMANLAGLNAADDGFASLEEVILLYEQWIKDKHSAVHTLNADYQGAATRHLDECSGAATRMRAGLNHLKSNQMARTAFQLANYAILLQQIRTSPITREFHLTPKTLEIEFAIPFDTPDPLAGGTRGKWRPFQIAFLLMSIISTADGESSDRRKVDLIWFPTGGGKTEAYLGLTAFSIFYRRFIDPTDVGTNVLMRYTLRLLTAQQFQRASGLICAMEHLRRTRQDLGTDVFSIGIWLGGDTTPNRRKEALAKLKELQKDGTKAENQFIVDRCPWCRALIGPHNVKGLREKVLGYKQSGDTVIMCCTDKRCEFRDALPIYVIDEDVYDKRPSLVIGTVDKFATLAWRPQARALFGIDGAGARFSSPPGLIIQDELHLISGPLGSMVGLYEAVIEDLCTDHRKAHSIPPKIVCSTATIRRYSQQVLDLFGRTDVALFPPPGIDVEDSFFSKYARNSAGALERGRKYIGIHAPGLGSLQTAQVRTFAALLQAPTTIPWPERDPWWTLLMFYNSLRELGTSISLFQSDVPDYLNTIWERFCISESYKRAINEPMELTGRLRSDEVPAAIKSLERTCLDPRTSAVDCCLSSSIIEVGIDIDRLSLMCVVGQPKTTSQYIQVTGRVGRRWQERPGIVVTIYGASKPRDRSHFEKFRSYHERLYAQVEPTSVTPFSLPALERALHAILAAYVRQNGDQAQSDSPHPFPKGLALKLKKILIDRVRTINRGRPNPEQKQHLETIFSERCVEWEIWGRRYWDKPEGDVAPLLYRSGSYVKPADKLTSWATPNSMRNVDASCEIEITKLYALENEAHHG